MRSLSDRRGLHLKDVLILTAGEYVEPHTTRMGLCPIENVIDHCEADYMPGHGGADTMTERSGVCLKYHYESYTNTGRNIVIHSTTYNNLPIKVKSTVPW